MKRITYFVPTVKGTTERECYRIWLQVGPVKRCFALQFENDRPCILADYASGYRLADLRAIRLRLYNRIDWRQAAQDWVCNAVKVRGLDQFNAVLRSVPVLNREMAE